MAPRAVLPHLSAGLLMLGILLLPLLGARLVSRDVPGLWEFPPLLRVPQDYPRFAWWAVPIVVGGFLLITHPLLAAWRRARTTSLSPTFRAPPLRPVPWWGWLAVAWTALWWGLAWTRLPDFSALQRFTFFPLWLGFILVMNAWSTRRGSSTMLRMPGRWLILFGLSSGFWWGFEWLNRFVRNWHYLGVESFTAPTYALQASLCFATVLPAVLAVREGWTADQAWLAPFERAWSWSRERMRRSAWLLLLVGAGALVLTGAYPEWTYPLLWVAPLLFGLAWAFWWRPDRLRWLQRGDWRPAAAWGAAGLFCGFWWECWNVISLAKWIYTVPYVERWHLFEMPLLGYAGYVPFGWFCGLVAGGLLEPAREPA